MIRIERILSFAKAIRVIRSIRVLFTEEVF